MVDEQYEYDVVVYLKCIDQGTDNECWIVCSKDDPGAIAFTPVEEI